MGYKKSIKGDSNQANEEFSHNRIIVNMGASGVIGVLFICALIVAVIAWAAINYMWAVSGVLAVLVIGSLLYGATFLGERVSNMRTTFHQNKIRARTIESAAPLVVHQDGEAWYNFSAELEAAKIPRYLPPPKDEPQATDDTLLELYQKGLTLQTICQSTGATYYRVQKLIETAKKNGIVS